LEVLPEVGEGHNGIKGKKPKALNREQRNSFRLGDQHGAFQKGKVESKRASDAEGKAGMEGGKGERATW